MANQSNWGRLGTILADWFPAEDLRLEEPAWLLLAILPVSLSLIRLWLNRRQQDDSLRTRHRRLADINWRNAKVKEASVIVNRPWRRRCIDTILILSMLLLAWPAARPISNTVQAKDKMLIIWVYDASTSMSTVDVNQAGKLISRLDASVSALETSLEAVPPNFHKLLISFAGQDEINVNLPTFNNAELLAQARQIQRGEFTATDYGLERAVSACQQFFNSKDEYPCVIFLLSDGECNPRPQCRLRTQEIAKTASENSIVIHTVSWGDMRSDYRPNPDDMRDIANIGQGQHLVSAQTEELATLYQDVVSSLEVKATDYALSNLLVWPARALILIWSWIFWLRRLE